VACGGLASPATDGELCTTTPGFSAADFSRSSLGDARWGETAESIDESGLAERLGATRELVALDECFDQLGD
jgi:hypothetical protein